MSERFRLNCKHLLMVAACGLGMLALASGQTRAGTLEIVISDGTTSFDILDNGPLDTNPAVNVITALASALTFPNFAVVGLNSATNNPGADNPIGAVLSVGGQIQRITGGAAATLTITATDTDYVRPAGPQQLRSGATGAFGGVPTGDSQQFTSWFNPNNTPLAKQLSSGDVSFVSGGIGLQTFNGTTGFVGVGSAPTYGLTNETALTMSGSPVGTPTIVFGGLTQVLTIPEPTSLAIMLPALPVVIMGWLRHRKARATSAS